ncbi:MAG TPA: histidine phosphatase family protein [bacterium]|nr:histidine phosphatase family protein [bacterium]
MDLGSGSGQDARVLDAPTDFCRLWLLRHPELEAGHAELAVGAGPADLSRRGRAQLLRWLESLREVELTQVACGPQPQCHDPARGLAEQKGLEVTVDARLRDQEMGEWQGRAWRDITRDQEASVRSFFSEFGEVAPPGGETLGDAVERMLQWWTETMPQMAGKSLAVVCPGTLLTGFVAAMLGMRLSRSLSLNLPFGGVGVLDVFQNGVRVACWNPDALR